MYNYRDTVPTQRVNTMLKAYHKFNPASRVNTIFSRISISPTILYILPHLTSLYTL